MVTAWFPGANPSDAAKVVRASFSAAKLWILRRSISREGRGPLEMRFLMRLGRLG